ncbi:MAG: hypothetical protein MUO40_04150 [Anaerolineaceae bacterium]|nr:hypothetical protein [Anaerolineaceae bacterium]
MKKNKLFQIILFTGLILFTILPSTVQAQTPAPYTIRLNRDFGYGGGSNVRGTFSLRISGDQETIQEVTYFIDNELMHKTSTDPFRFQFNTDDYGFGWHDLGAEILTKNGGVISLNPIRYNFVTPEEETSGIKNILVPIGVVILVAFGISALVQTLGKPKKLAGAGQPRSYGVLGGVICPKCGYPYPRHFWGINMGIGKLDRCESCGKWSITTRATPDQLAAAEASLSAQDGTDVHVQPVKDKSDDFLDDSKYIDSI